MDSEVEEIKQKIDIVELISSYVTLKKAGTNYKGLCPFHNEKTPSMMVSPEKQIFKCFGCNEGGDVFSFLMKVEGLGFGDALKTLAERAGVTLKPNHFQKLSAGEQPGQKSRLLELSELATRLYHKILTDHPAAKIAREYVEKRGLTKQTISEFNLGYAPNSWDLLIRFALSRGFTEKDLLAAGLTVRKNQIQNDNRQSYDRFRERLLFPINNVLGSPVAFTGRLLEDKEDSPKYLNSSESPIYRKSSTIYGLDKARLSIRKEDLAVLVEGNMDVVTCHQAGFKNVVAVSGTALTKDMLQALSRYTFNLAFSFDQDNAGRLALKRAISMAGELDLNTRIVVLPSKFKDPDEAIKDDPKNWSEAVTNAKPALEFLISYLSKDVKDILSKKTVIKEIIPLVKLLKNKSEQAHYIKMLSTKLLISEKSLEEDLRRVVSGKAPEEEKSNSIDDQPVMSNIECLFSLLNFKPEIITPLVSKILKNLSEEGKSAEMVKQIKNLTEITPKNLKAVFQKSSLSERLSENWLKIQNDLDDKSNEALSAYADEIAGKINKTLYEEKKNELILKISQADQKNDKKLRLTLLKELNSVIINQDN